MKKNKLEVHTYTLPAYWASGLINGDISGMEDKEIEEMNKFLTDNNLPAPSSCSEESSFTWYNDAFSGIGCDCLEYHFLIPA